MSRGVDDIITVLTTDASEWQKRPAVRVDTEPATDLGDWLLIAGLLIFGAALIVSPSLRFFVFNLLASMAVSSGRGGFSGGGSFGGGFPGGGGFSGGGGSSGGGGASGSW